MIRLVWILNKNKKLPEGTIRIWSGKKYKKISNKWTRIYDKNKKVINLNEKLEKKISEELNISKNNIYIHSTLNSGIEDLFLNKRTDDYLSASTLKGSTKFIEKYGEEGKTIFAILDTPKEKVDFHEYGDVGWKGGGPKRTSYDEAGLKDWELKGWLIPDYYKNNEKIIANALLANYKYFKLSDGEELPIIGANPELLNKIEEDIQEEYDSDPGENSGWDFLERMLKKYS